MPLRSGTFSATCDELDEQVRFLKRRWHLAGLDEAIEIVEGKSKVKGAAILLTFDDGYLDNYESAFPILSSARRSGRVLPAGCVHWLEPHRLVGCDSLHRQEQPAAGIRTDAAGVHRFDIAAEGVRPVIARVLGVYKSLDAADGERFIRMLEEVCGAARPEDGERCFMNWEEAEAMQRGGMAIGSHTQSHKILSKLPAEEHSRRWHAPSRFSNSASATRPINSIPGRVAGKFYAHYARSGREGAIPRGLLVLWRGQHARRNRTL